MTMKNNYEIRGEVTVIFLNRKDGTVLETLIDTNDLARADEYPGTWCTEIKKTDTNPSYYVVGGSFVAGRHKRVSFHRWITYCPENLMVDHINHETLDNRRSCSLRIVTDSQNKQNRKGAQVNNKTSGIRGVTWHKQIGKWHVRVGLNGKKICIGLFDDLHQAKEAAEKARAELLPFSKEAQEKKEAI